MGFWNINKNNIYGKSISDYLIYLTLNAIGNNKESVVSLFDKDLRINENIESENLISLFIGLPNKCIVGISIENEHAYKVTIYLNKKITKREHETLKIWENLHSKDYLFYYKLNQETNKPYIGFESRKY